MIDPPRLANLLSAGQPKLNFFIRKEIKCEKCEKKVKSGMVLASGSFQACSPLLMWRSLQMQLDLWAMAHF